MKLRLFVALSMLVLFAFSLKAQEATTSIELDEIITVGTRVPERSRLDSPVPVDVINEDAIRKTGHTEVGRVLQTLAPSFNFSSSSISDGTDALRPATLRGLGPDQVLVLVNGKRRHGSALIHVNTSVGRGTAGVDLNAIPASAIKRIEILRDGASAQYGSDALAGVINLVLKDDYEGGLGYSYGSTYAGDGETFSLNAHKGFKFGNDGTIHGAIEYRDRQPTNRAGLTGVLQYPGSEVKEGSPVQLVNDAGNKEHSFDRQNFRIGDAESRQGALVLNLDKPIDSIWQGASFYSFLDYSNRQNTSAGFYRRANQLDRNPEGSDYPDGFLPLINTNVLDYSIGVGIKQKFNSGLRMDASVVTGGNSFAFNISNSHNASLVAAEGSSPSSADAGDLRLFLNTVDLDFSLPTDWGNVAVGGGFRNDIYQITAGEEVSYKDYDGPDGASGGIQVFPGFQPSNEVNELRTAFAFYTDVELNPIGSVFVNPAARVENYSDFGSTVNGKMALRYEPIEELALRGSASTGFRAPSMQQLYFNNVSTQFNTVDGQSVAQEIGTFRNDSDIAKAVGIPELTEETAVNVSSGFILHPLPRLTLTADVYRATIRDRIIISGRLASGNEGIPSGIRKSLADSGVAGAQFFMNAADTQTQGIDVVASYTYPVFEQGRLLFSFAANYTETEITDVNLPANLPESLFTEQDRSIIETWQPKDRVSMSTRYTNGSLGVDYAVHRYGEYTVIDGGKSQTFTPKYLTDIQISYGLGEYGRIKIGANNLFNVTPDENHIGQSRGGKIVDPWGNVIVDSPGVFTYSRRSAPFGFNGGLYYIGWENSF